VILCENGEMYECSEAIIRIAEILGGFYRLAVVFRIIPKSIRDALYNFIAGHRYQWFGKRESCMIPDLRLSNRFLP
jgi:predicted DCC family thiol-disulfide oxidoreductase YuxK